MLWPGAPQSITPYRSAWENRDAQVFERLPAERKQKYAEFYDELSNNWAIMQAEQAQWIRLIPYAELGPRGLADRRTIRPVIVQMGDANATLEANLPISLQIADELKVKEVQPDATPTEWLKHVAECRSAIASPAETAKLNPKS